MPGVQGSGQTKGRSVFIFRPHFLRKYAYGNFPEGTFQNFHNPAFRIFAAPDGRKFHYNQVIMPGAVQFARMNINFLIFAGRVFQYFHKTHALPLQADTPAEPPESPAGLYRGFLHMFTENMQKAG
jgi:hypothetical protein